MRKAGTYIAAVILFSLFLIIEAIMVAIDVLTLFRFKLAQRLWRALGSALR